MSTLIFTPTWLTDAGHAMRRETRASIEEQRLPASSGALEWVIGVENPFGPHDLRNVLHQYRNARRAALEGGFDALVTVEHDIRLPDADAVKRLLATEAEVVFGVYLLRHGEPILNTYRYEGDKNVGDSLTLHKRDLMAARRRATVRVSGIGWGCTLIRRSVLERMELGDGGGANPAGDTAFATDCLRARIPMLARWDVMCGHYDPVRGWLWPFKECATMVKVIGVQRVIMRGGFRLTPGTETELPEDVADDAVRAGFASYVEAVQGPSTNDPRIQEFPEAEDASGDVDAVQPGKGAKVGARRGGRSGGRGGG